MENFLMSLFILIKKFHIEDLRSDGNWVDNARVPLPINALGAGANTMLATLGNVSGCEYDIK